MLRFSLQEDPRASLMAGVTEFAVPLVTATEILKQLKRPLVVLLDRNLKQAEQWAADTRFFFSSLSNEDRLELLSFPETPDLRGEEDPRVFERLCDRLSVLGRLASANTGNGGLPLVLATTPEALFSPVVSPEALRNHQITLAAGKSRPLPDLVDQLTCEMDYDHEAVCEQPGQFAVRGGLIDIYPLNENRPYRIDFFDDEIESIRSFDPTTQRTDSESAPSRLILFSSKQSSAEEQPGAFFDYLPEGVHWVVREPDLLEQENPSFFQIPEKKGHKHLSFEKARNRPGGKKDRWLGLAEIDTDRSIFGNPQESRPLQSQPLSNFRRFPRESEIGLDRFESEQSARGQFLLQLLDWQREGYALWFVLHSKSTKNRIQEITSQDPVLRELAPRYLEGELHQGFVMNSPPVAIGSGASPSPPVGMIVATESELLGRHRRRLTRLRERKRPDRSQVDQMLDFSELADGDPIVHLQNGICLFRGLTRMSIRDKEEEVISLEFAEGAMLHVPLHESHLLSRYVGLTKSAPKLAKLGSRTWERTRAAAEKATLDFASELLNLQARRDSAEGFTFEEDHSWLAEFENSFEFKETPDQLSAIRETKADMAKERPMDRLICGDVGFGKTEVALRAAFMAVLNGKQVALLVPTTVLCQQHFNTFRERMADYPVVVEMVSRFRKPSQNKAILEQARQGKIDILIGTHRMLSADVDFSQLGLLVIDEEQRFGVRQKEALKSLKAHVDVLTLSATPIPRTLYLALVGAREMSVIETPPQDRLPIHTVVKGYSRELVQNAVRQEISRGGQIFYLHNRVQTINRVAARLEQWFPELNIAVGHGQMDESQLEQIMTRFVAGEFDILVCTTIIESGLDIPNCNTMIIEGADRFGLSQLYQLRGRVGRFKRQAYCYLLLHEKTHLQDQARKRLSSIRQYNQLGAGFRIAMRDLELRGAGNLLGAEQSGHIAGVGFDLYCQLLRQSISRLKGEGIAQQIRATLRLDFMVTRESAMDQKPQSGEPRGGYSILKASSLEAEKIPRFAATLPEYYINESRLRIEFFRELALATDLETIQQIKDSLEDRFGPLPEPSIALIKMTEIRVLAEQKGISLVQSKGNRLKLKIARAKDDNFVKVGPRFPRLTRKSPLKRLEEIRSHLNRIPSQL